jgi:hypothetical protein
MSKPQINEIGRRVILLPKETTYCEAYLAVSVRPEGNVVLGMNQQYSLFYELCDLAALCEGGDLLMSGAVVTPERYLKEWRRHFKEAKPMTDSSNQDLLISAKLVVDPSMLQGHEKRWDRESLQELRQAHPGVPVGDRIEFQFDLANPLQAKLMYEKHRLHFDTSEFPVQVRFKETANLQMATMDLFAEAA